MLPFAGRLFAAAFIAAGTAQFIFSGRTGSHLSLPFGLIVHVLLGLLILKLSTPANSSEDD